MDALLHNHLFAGSPGSRCLQGDLVDWLQAKQWPMLRAALGGHWLELKSREMRRVENCFVGAFNGPLRAMLPGFSAANLRKILCRSHRKCASVYAWTRLSELLAHRCRKCLTHRGGIFNNKTGFYHMKKQKWFQGGENQAGHSRLDVTQDWLKQGNMADGARGPCRKSAGQGSNLYGWKVR